MNPLMKWIIRKGEIVIMQQLHMKKHSYPGKLITFCGLDGCGKTSMIKRLADYMEAEGAQTVLTKQPTRAVRKSEIFRNYMDEPEHGQYEYRSLSLLAASDRIQHTAQVIEPLLKEGKTVISDRYFYSCLANLRARGYEKDQWIYEIGDTMIEPDAAFFLDIDVDTAVKRVRSRETEKNRFIDMDLQYRLHDEYQCIAKVNQYPLIESSGSEEETFARVQGVLRQKGILAGRGAELNDNMIEDVLRRHGKVHPEEFKDEMTLQELGYDSMAQTELVVDLEELLGFEIPLELLRPTSFATVFSVKEMVKKARG